MTQEEKAKAYDIALEKIKMLLGTGSSCSREELEYVFPELKESEDERIRKAIIDVLKAVYECADTPFISQKQTLDSYVAWLDKQGETSPILSNSSNIGKDEQKPADKVEPKFKVGDSISKKHNSDINKFGTFTITSIADNKYWYNDSVICDFSDQDLWEFVERPKFKKGDWVFHNTAKFIYMIQTIGRDGYGVISRYGEKSVVYYSAEINYRLWTIQDAKDGDVLMANAPFIFNGNLEGGIGCPGAHCGINTLGNFQIPKDKKHWTGHTTTPATEEQRALLFQKMHEAGYEWNAEKKELKKIEQKPVEDVNGEDYGIDGLWHAIRILESTLGEVEGYQSDDGILEHKCAITTVKELYEQKPEWSEEDHRMKHFAYCRIYEYEKKAALPDAEDACKCMKWLDSLEDRYVPQPKEEWLNELDKVLETASPEQIKEWKEKYFKEDCDEWSEEDEEKINSICNIIADKRNIQKQGYKSYYNGLIDWLKSLKDRCQPQPRLKWSDEDEKRLSDIIVFVSGYAMKEVNKDWVNFLKSLRPQKQWEPSEEQMEALQKECIAHSNYQLCRLLEQLKKLKG